MTCTWIALVGLVVGACELSKTDDDPGATWTGDPTGDADTTGDAGTTGDGMPLACAGEFLGLSQLSTPYVEGGPSGYRICEEEGTYLGPIDRVQAVPCELGERPEPNGCGIDSSECTSHADCAETEFCSSDGWGTCTCERDCRQDADCVEGQVCLCPTGRDFLPGEYAVVTDGPRCIPADCRTGADCDSGVCGLDFGSDPCIEADGLHCRSVEDTCYSTSLCESDACVWGQDYWICGSYGGACE